MATGYCPDCDGQLGLSNPRLGQKLLCPYCDTQLEVIALEPLELDWAIDISYATPSWRLSPWSPWSSIGPSTGPTRTSGMRSEKQPSRSERRPAQRQWISARPRLLHRQNRPTG